jgi:hypothetical protein
MLPWVVRLWLITGGISLLLACHAASAIQIIESGVEAADRSPVFWISPDEILFFGPSGEHFIRSDGFRKPVNRLTTWNLRSKQTKRFNEIDFGLCYYQGNIAFREIDSALMIDWTSIGRFPGDIKRFDGALAFDPLTCVPAESLVPLPAWTKDHSIMRLRPEHGFLDLGPQRERGDNAIRFVRGNNEKPIELPIRPREVVLAWVQYYPHKGAYFFPSSFSKRDRTNPRLVRWLYPDGKVEDLAIPPAKWTHDTLVPTKAGIVALDSTFFTITGEAPWDGVYLLTARGWAPRVSKGLFHEHALSEEGCKLAVNRQPEPGRRRPEYWTITIYDVCGGR